MWAIILILYLVLSIIDINSFSKSSEKGKLPLYITLMTISCAIGTANEYIPNMINPAEIIKNIVQAVIGS
jgi:hypothetical protein